MIVFHEFINIVLLQALLDLLVNGCLHQYNEEKLLYLAESARLYVLMKCGY